MGTCHALCPYETRLAVKPVVTAGLAGGGGGSFPQSPQPPSPAQTQFSDSSPKAVAKCHCTGKNKSSWCCPTAQPLLAVAAWAEGALAPNSPQHLLQAFVRMLLSLQKGQRSCRQVVPA